MADSNSSSSQKLTDKLAAFCKKKGIATSGVLALTVQRNRKTESGAMIINFDAKTPQMLQCYPHEFNKACTEGRVDDLLFAWVDNLDSSVLDRQPMKELDEAKDETKEDSVKPFCCENLTPYRPRPTSKDSMFKDFLASTGSAKGIIFEIKSQVDRGRLLSVKYFRLHDGKISEVKGQFTQKIHTFKNYKCRKHNRFFGVDLYRETDSTGYNYHHMRASAFAKQNDSLFEELFKKVNTD